MANVSAQRLRFGLLLPTWRCTPFTWMQSGGYGLREFLDLGLGLGLKGFRVLGFRVMPSSYS